MLASHCRTDLSNKISENWTINHYWKRFSKADIALTKSSILPRWHMPDFPSAQFTFFGLSFHIYFNFVPIIYLSRFVWEIYFSINFFYGSTDEFFFLLLFLSVFRTENLNLCLSNIIFVCPIIYIKQQYQLFPLPWFGWVGLESGVGEPVLGHKDLENVSLVVNDCLPLTICLRCHLPPVTCHLSPVTTCHLSLKPTDTQGNTQEYNQSRQGQDRPTWNPSPSSPPMP